jgi:hypothetical protein
MHRGCRIGRRLGFWLAGLLWLAPLASQSQLAPLTAEPAFVRSATEALDQMYGCHFRAASQRFASLASAYPDHPAPAFLQAANEWTQIHFDPSDVSRDARLFAYLRDSEALATRMRKQAGRQLEADFYLFSLHALRARLLNLRGQTGAAARALLGQMGVLRRSRSEPGPLRPELLFGLGLYNYYSEWYREQKPYLGFVFAWFPRGNKALGLRQLDSCAKASPLCGVSARTFLSEIYLNSEGRPLAASIHIAALQRAYPTNPQFALLQTQVLMGLGKWSEAEAASEAMALSYQVETQRFGEPVRIDQSAMTTHMAVQIALLLMLTYADQAERLYRLIPQTREEALGPIYLEQGLASIALGKLVAGKAKLEAVLALQTRESVKAKAKSALSLLKS